jgi:hypothetical protein
MQEYDKCGKYLIQHRGNSILRLGGVNDIDRWAPRQAEPVQLRQLPDGVLEAWTLGQAKPDIFVLEIATDPDARVPSQAVRDAAVIYLERGILPEVIVLYLREKGNVPAADSVELQSRRGFTKLSLSWKAIRLWEIPAEDLLAMDDVGLLPWVPLAKVDGSPEQIVRRCRARLDEAAPQLGHPDYENLLVATQFLLPLRYNWSFANRPLRPLK